MRPASARAAAARRAARIASAVRPAPARARISTSHAGSRTGSTARIDSAPASASAHCPASRSAWATSSAASMRARSKRRAAARTVGDVGQLSEGVAPPRCQLGGEQRPARRSGIRPHPAQCPFELHGVDDVVVVRTQRVPLVRRSEPVAHEATQPGDLRAQRVERARRWVVAPHGVDQGSDRDHFVEACQQRGEHQALGPAADRQLAAILRHPQRTEHAELHVRTLRRHAPRSPLATLLQRRRKRPPARSPAWRRCSRSGRTPTTRPSSPPGSWPPPWTAATAWSASRQPPASAAHLTPRRGPPHASAALRRWEAAAAMAVLGVTEHRILGYPDGELPAIDHEAGVARMAALITEVAPDIIVTFGPDGTTFHPDHVTVHRWVTAAWERLQRPARLLLLGDHLRAPLPLRRPLRGMGRLHDRRTACRCSARRAWPSRSCSRARRSTASLLRLPPWSPRPAT